MKYKILLVEDNEPIRENTAELLELSGYDVAAASNGKDGLNIALKYLPDLILSDIRMPLMDGYDFLQQIRKLPSLANSLFVFLTASCESKEIIYAMSIGANDYIVKPFSGIELLDKINKLLSENIFQHIENQLPG